MRPAVTTWFARVGFAWARNRLAAETRRELEMHRAGDWRDDRGVQRGPGGAAGAAAVRPVRSAGPVLSVRTLTSPTRARSSPTSPSDRRVFAATALVLTITGLAAVWLPARRASRVPPTVALQE